MTEEIIQDWLADWSGLDSSQIHSYATVLDHNEELIQALHAVLEENATYYELQNQICDQLFSYYRSREKLLQNFTLQFFPTFMYSYLRAVAGGDKKSCRSVETLLLGIYNLEVVTDAGEPLVFSFRLPSLVQSSIYHEPTRETITDAALRRFEEVNTKPVTWGPHPQTEVINAQNRLKILTALLFVFNRNIALLHRPSLKNLCRNALKIMAQGFPSKSNLASSGKSNSARVLPRIPVSSQFLLQLASALYYAMYNDYGYHAMEAINDMYRRSCFECYSDVILVVNAIKNSSISHVSPTGPAVSSSDFSNGQPDDAHMDISCAVSPASTTVTTVNKSMITNASFRTKKLPAEDLVVNPKDFPGIKKGDVLEIYHPEDETSRLLLQITAFKEDFQTRDAISVEVSIASTFQLRGISGVYVNMVSLETVALDSLEVTFKDQYLGRSEMWRLKNSLVNTCVHLNKKIEFCGGSIRCQVYEMWSQGDSVACGVVTEDTKIVFRSNTSMVYLFLQMSSEMWDFDVHGDLYFEKAVNGFLADLFQKWKKHGSFHEVTIVLFSRTFYEATSLDQFPHFMRECLQQDYKGRFYEDFYRVVVQNERYEEWGSTLVQLRRLFNDYQQQVVEYHKRAGVVTPKAVNSTAAQGNFLEVLNMSLNVFEKHYLDRSFDRTGQLSVVITPGVGVFEVDRQVTNVTKQRIIDNGVGSDLVCVGEQPLHAVPLLKFHNKDSDNTVDDYSMPHWINLSFYSTNKKLAHCNFTPRIKLPPKKEAPPPDSPKLVQDEEILPNSVFDYDAYDAEVYQLPSQSTTKSRSANAAKKGKPTASTHVYSKGSITLDGPDPHKLGRKMSDPDIHHTVTLNRQLSSASSRSTSTTVPPGSPISPMGTHNLDVSMDLSLTEEPPRTSIGSPDSQILTRYSQKVVRSGRALINPFDPSHVTIKLTSNRRRWTHIFPKGPTGVLIQQHHYQAVPAHKILQPLDAKGLSRSKGVAPATKANKTLLWGATGEQEWTPALTTAIDRVIIGVDWKSLTIPACLPITTDYFPDKRSLQNDYLFSDYSLLPDDVNADFAQLRAIYKLPLSTKEVFRELVSQRLAQGFQLIVLPQPGVNGESSGNQPSSLVRTGTASNESSETYLLSIGRIFHKISLSGSAISVTRYRPRHPYHPYNIQYRYRFHAPDHPTYEMSWASFTTEKLENYSWNYLDHYICTRGDTEVPLTENLKYWRFRTYLLPLSWNSSVTKRIMDGTDHCDMYSKPTITDQIILLETFLRYIEIWINKVKRPNPYKKPRSPILGASIGRRRHSTALTNFQSSTVGSSPFRDRLGSFRLPDKPRPRSGSKVMERGRVSPMDSIASSDSGVFDYEGGEDSPEIKLKAGSTAAEILDAMRHPVQGVGFLAAHADLPSWTFTSADAVVWLVGHVDGVHNGDDASAIMDTMLKEKLICHASGDFSHPFIIGFYLYHVCLSDKDSISENEYSHPVGDLHSFRNEWVEVEVRHPCNWRKAIEEPREALPPFLAGELQEHCHDTQKPARSWPNPLYRQVHLEIDVSNKSDRVEWGHCRYQSLFSPSRAFELVVQWEVASGSIVADLLTQWSRKALTAGLLMVPLPGDPLAMPFASKSDPLRGPVFIPLDTDCLIGPSGYMFEDFPEDTWAARLVLFQEAIVQNFGFIPSVVEARRHDKSASEAIHHHHHQYVHLTGNIFILIPSAPCSRADEQSFPVTARRITRKQYPLLSEVVPSPHEEYITRHVSGYSQDYDSDHLRPGFLWFWNHMISKRWKSSTTPATGDEAFQNKILKDFREFCANTNNRLKEFWVNCHEKKLSLNVSLNSVSSS